MDSNDPIPVPLAINNEQQSKSLDVFDSSCILGSNFLPQYIVLKSLKIRYALYLFSNVKSIKVDEITIDINTDTDTNSLRSLLSIVSANDMNIEIHVSKSYLHRFILALEIIFNSLSPTKPPYLQLIVRLYHKLYENDASPILYDTWKRCGAIKLKKAVIVDDKYGEEKYLELR